MCGRGRFGGVYLVITVFERLRWEDLKFEASLGYQRDPI